MAKDYQDIDRLFRDKLRDHAVQPSPLAWDKLEGRMEKRKKKPLIISIRVAASLLLAGGLAALLWLSVENTKEGLDHSLAVQGPIKQPPALQKPVQPDPVPVDPKEEMEKQEAPKATISRPAAKKPTAVPLKSVQVPAADVEPDPVGKEDIPILELDGVALPPLDQDLLLAENNVELAATPVEEVAYKVTIISNGLREKPQKEGLVGEIENKIDQLGGLIGKVDQGFADLQDAKNNLFASITTRK